MRRLILLALFTALPAAADDGVVSSYRQLLGEANERVAQLNAQVAKLNVQAEKLTEEAKKCEPK